MPWPKLEARSMLVAVIEMAMRSQSKNWRLISKHSIYRSMT